MKLSVKYRGPDVERGRMNALDLGPAIFGVGQMVGGASRTLFNDDTRVRAEVQADFPRASFGIEFFAVAAVRDLLASITLEQLAAVATILGFGGVGAVQGVLKLLRWQRGRKIDSVEQIGDRYTIKIQDDSVNITINEYKVFVNPEVRQGFKALVQPLESEGVTEVAVKAENEPEERITREERDIIAAAPLPEEEVSVDRSTAILEIIGLSFRQGNKWRFSQGGGTFYADILDEDFLRQVSTHRELFGSGDALRVELEIRTTRSGTDLRFDYTVLHVIEHIPATRGNAQLPLV